MISVNEGILNRKSSAVTRLPSFSELMLSANRSHSIANSVSLDFRSRLSSTSSWPIIGQGGRSSASNPPLTDTAQCDPQTRMGGNRNLVGNQFDRRGSGLDHCIVSGLAYSIPPNGSIKGSGHAEYTTQAPQQRARIRLGSLDTPIQGGRKISEPIFGLHEDLVRAVQLASRSLSEILVFQEMLELRCNIFMEKKGASIQNGRDPCDQSAVLAFEDFLLYFSLNDLNECMSNAKNLSNAVDAIRRTQAEYLRANQHRRDSFSERMPRFGTHAPHHHRGSTSQVPLQLQRAAQQLQNLDGGTRVQHVPMHILPPSASCIGSNTLSAPPASRKRKLISCEKPVSCGGEVMKLDIHVTPHEYSGHSHDFELGGLNLGLSARPNIACQHCSSKKTPEWRRGPDGRRTLCNACGLFYSKMIKKYGLKEANTTMNERRRAGLVMDRHIT